jgi:hypothetical protein
MVNVEEEEGYFEQNDSLDEKIQKLVFKRILGNLRRMENISSLEFTSGLSFFFCDDSSLGTGKKRDLG